MWLAAHSGHRRRDEIEELVLGRWQRFLRREERLGDYTWRIVHQSFADFLAKRPELDVIATHNAMANSLPDRLPLPAGRRHNGYAFRHLSGAPGASGQTQ